MNNDLRLIKKYYGEDFAHLCRELFPILLEKEGLLFSIISKEFAYNKYLYTDLKDNYLIEEFKNYIYSLFDFERKKIITEKTPEELLFEAGYDLYECKTEEDIQSFKKYYAENEELCTFKGGRLAKCHVFFAVKKDVDKIKREEFTTPNREDEYSTSVLSIQFFKGIHNNVSIKSRYNHHVDNPDATYHNNLENIIPGLTDSFEVKYHLNVTNSFVNFDLDRYGYVRATDGKFYKFIYEVNGIYYCPNNMIIENGKINNRFSDKSRYLFLDHYILDMQRKMFVNYNYDNTSFIDTIPYIDKVEINLDKEHNKRKIIISCYSSKIEIIIDQFGRIVSYKNDLVTHIGHSFLTQNKVLETICLENLYTIGDNFLVNDINLREFYFPNVEEIGNNFLEDNKKVKKVNLPNIKKIGTTFISKNEIIDEVYAPLLEKVGSWFLFQNSALERIELPKLLEVDNSFLSHDKNLKKIYLPKVYTFGHFCFLECDSMDYLILPSTMYVGDNFFNNNRSLKSASFPNLIYVGHNFFKENRYLYHLDAPKLKITGCRFFNSNNQIYEEFLDQVNQEDKNFQYEILKKFNKYVDI